MYEEESRRLEVVEEAERRSRLVERSDVLDEYIIRERDDVYGDDGTGILDTWTSATSRGIPGEHTPSLSLSAPACHCHWTLHASTGPHFNSNAGPPTRDRPPPAQPPKMEYPSGKSSVLETHSSRTAATPPSLTHRVSYTRENNTRTCTRALSQNYRRPPPKASLSPTEKQSDVMSFYFSRIIFFFE